MALNRDKDLKLYYSIKEVAAMFDVKESALRYWEKMFPQIQPKTNARGIRQYTKENIEEIRLIHNMTKVRGFKLAAAKKMLSNNRRGVEKNAQIMELLLSSRDKLLELKKQLDILV
jgi:DNA-binding transcriptional MerR regulator